MTIFSCYNISKSFASGMIFEDLAFGMELGERVGLIGKNGIGKTSLLNILAGNDSPDSGEVVFNNEARIEYLKQNPRFEKNDIILDVVLKSNLKIYEALIEYDSVCSKLNENFDEELSKKSEELSLFIEHKNAWNYENEAKTILSKLGITDYYGNVSHLSGGMKKRVALASALLSEPDLLILDEPTNHLDADSVQWLQDRLMASKKSLLFVTHDRYFLDAVSTRIIELDDSKIYSFPGNFEDYLLKKSNIEDVKNSTIEHKKSILRVELAWLMRGARARRSKQKSKIDWIKVLKEETKKKKEKKIQIELGNIFLGKRIIEAYNIGKSIADKKLFEDFTYLAKPGDRIGIIGPNGSGKTTLLNVLSDKLKVDTGLLKAGQSIKIGYFTQDSEELKENMTVSATLKEIAEYIDVGFGRHRYLTVADLLERFLFPRKQHNALVSTLSGGERRRLQILRVLMGNPNILFLDEPTNDLDIQTLQALENYLDDFYGVLIIVSHDRAFLDRTINFVWAFDGKGKIKEYPGNYSYYLDEIEKKTPKNENKGVSEKHRVYKEKKQQKEKKKLSYKEQLEYDKLELEISDLEKEKSELEEKLKSGEITDFNELDLLSKKLVNLSELIDEKMLRWMELGEKFEN